MPEYEKTAEDIKYDEFLKEIASVINKYSMENGSNTPDFMLAEMLGGFLNVYNNTLQNRKQWSNGRLN